MSWNSRHQKNRLPDISVVAFQRVAAFQHIAVAFHVVVSNLDVLHFDDIKRIGFQTSALLHSSTSPSCSMSLFQIWMSCILMCRSWLCCILRWRMFLVELEFVLCESVSFHFLFVVMCCVLLSCAIWLFLIWMCCILMCCVLVVFNLGVLHFDVADI
jgi:hypothetical protein